MSTSSGLQERASGLRERKKAETRLAVHRAALDLVAEHGFDGVTVEAIADVANISRRTFFNYFTDKADAVMYGEEARFRELIAAVRSRPPGEGGWQALRRAAEDLTERRGEPDREAVLRGKLTRRHPSLLARQMAGFGPLERELAQAITERDGDGGMRPRVLAAAYTGAVRVANITWLEKKQGGTLRDILLAALDELEKPFTR
ncbi:TetR family transcriptional regulator [Actinocorallia libanotica]|uniref:TetR family transcriptional regulator n=1 Tax=Actinocorallia libanotica TaxID=46162 RepID=A0ABN1Q6I1_9ACTN